MILHWIDVVMYQAVTDRPVVLMTGESISVHYIVEVICKQIQNEVADIYRQF